MSLSFYTTSQKVERRFGAAQFAHWRDRFGTTNFIGSCVGPDQVTFSLDVEPGFHPFCCLSIAWTLRHAQISNVLDLRIPQCRDWLISEFAPRFATGGVSEFLQLLGPLMSPAIGGTIFTNYLGSTLRQAGVGGLVYPSARCDVQAHFEYQDGTIKLADFKGWNFVDLRRGNDEPGDEALGLDLQVEVSQQAADIDEFRGIVRIVAGLYDSFIVSRLPLLNERRQLGYLRKGVSPWSSRDVGLSREDELTIEVLAKKCDLLGSLYEDQYVY